MLVRMKRTGLHSDIDYKLERLKYERIVLWQVDKGHIFFVATPDYELCIELYEWWSEIWTLENGSFPHSSHNFGLDVVHHFPIEIRTNEFAELINVGRLQAQSWCLKHGHKWCNANVAGFDFHGPPVAFTFSSANTTCSAKYLGSPAPIQSSLHY